MVLFLVGLAVSIPLSIVANLMTSRVQHALAERSATAKAKESADWKQLGRMAAWFAEHPAVYQVYLAHEIVKLLTRILVVVSGIVIMAAGLVIAGGDSGDPFHLRHLWANLAAIVGTGFTLFASTAAARQVRRIASVFSVARHAGNWTVRPGFLGVPDEAWNEFLAAKHETTSGPGTEP